MPATALQEADYGMSLAAIMLQLFWWPTNRRHCIRLYLKLSISYALITLFPAHEDVIYDQIWISTIQQPGVFHHGLDLNHTNLVPAKSGDWVPTFDPPIPSNGDW